MVRNLLYVLIGAFSMALLLMPGDRPPVADRGVSLAVVLDTSGSMAENGRLDEAREALVALTSALGQRDKLALVTFDREARVLVAPSRPSVPGITALLTSIQADGPTNLHNGLLVAHAQVMPLRGPRRVVVVTDSSGNLATHEGPLLTSASAMRTEGIPVRVLGYGDDPRLKALGRVGGGGYAPAQGQLTERLLDELERLRNAPVLLARR